MSYSGQELLAKKVNQTENHYITGTAKVSPHLKYFWLLCSSHFGKEHNQTKKKKKFHRFLEAWKAFFLQKQWYSLVLHNLGKTQFRGNSSTKS